MRDVPIQAVNRLFSCCTTLERDQDLKYLSRHARRLFREAGMPLKYRCGAACWQVRHARLTSWSAVISGNDMYYWEACSPGDQWKPHLDNIFIPIPRKTNVVRGSIACGV